MKDEERELMTNEELWTGLSKSGLFDDMNGALWDSYPVVRNEEEVWVPRQYLTPEERSSRPGTARAGYARTKLEKASKVFLKAGKIESRAFREFPQMDCSGRLPWANIVQCVGSAGARTNRNLFRAANWN